MQLVSDFAMLLIVIHYTHCSNIFIFISPNGIATKENQTTKETKQNKIKLN